MWHGVGRKYTSTFVICEGWVEWIQYGIQVRMNCKGWHDIYTTKNHVYNDVFNTTVN